MSATAAATAIVSFATAVAAVCNSYAVNDYRSDEKSPENVISAHYTLPPYFFYKFQLPSFSFVTFFMSH